MKTSRTTDTLRAFEVLLRGPLLERRTLLGRMDRREIELDEIQLRRLILDVVRGEYAPTSIFGYGKDTYGANRDSPVRAKSQARCWLLSTLGRIAGDHEEAAVYLRSCMAPEEEPYDWARYWTLEGLFVGEAPDLIATAKASREDPSQLVGRLAEAILAQQGDAAALTALRTAVVQREWAALRALRVVAVEELVAEVCDVVMDPQLDDATFDGIVALGSVGREWAAADRAADALEYAIKEATRHPWWDGLRREALAALRRLQPPRKAPLLIDQLADGNPAIVSEAAQALEAALGTEMAVQRVVESTSASPVDSVSQYGTVLRWMNRKRVVEELEALMVRGSPQQRQTAQSLLSEVGGSDAFERLRARVDAVRQHQVVLESTEQGLRELFDSSLEEARSGYRLATMMDVIVFLLGVAAFVLCGVLVHEGRETLGALTGAGGTVAMIYSLFVGGPRRRVQEAVEHLLALKVVFLGYLRQLHQADRAYVRRYLETESLTPDVLREYSDLVSATITDAVAHIRGERRRRSSGRQDAYTSRRSISGGGRELSVHVPQVRKDERVSSAKDGFDLPPGERGAPPALREGVESP